jgi:hypothetical protein
VSMRTAFDSGFCSPLFMIELGNRYSLLLSVSDQELAHANGTESTEQPQMPCSL